jgi:hypothetical protein
MVGREQGMVTIRTAGNFTVLIMVEDYCSTGVSQKIAAAVFGFGKKQITTSTKQQAGNRKNEEKMT